MTVLVYGIYEVEADENGVIDIGFIIDCLNSLSVVVDPA
jgi:hypothetical protein